MTWESVRLESFKWAVSKFCTKVLPKDAREFEKMMVRKGAMSMPVRSFFAMTAGAITYDATLGLLMAFNGRTCKGLYHFLKAMLSKKTALESGYLQEIALFMG